MRSIDIYIDGKPIDTDEQTDLGLSIQINDIENLDSRDSSKTYELTVPATKNNQVALQFLEDTNVGKTNQVVTGKIVANGFIFEGFVYWSESTIENGVSYYNFQLISDNYNWVTLVGESVLGDLFSTEYFSLTPNNIWASWSSDNDYIAALFDFGARSSFSCSDFVVGYKIKKLFTEIFNSRGFKIESSFIYSDEFDKLFFFNPEKFIRNLDALTDVNYYAGLTASYLYDGTPAPATVGIIPFDLVDTNPFYDANGYDEVNYKYVAPYQLKIKLSIKLDYTIQWFANTIISPNFLLKKRYWLCVSKSATPVNIGDSDIIWYKQFDTTSNVIGSYAGNKNLTVDTDELPYQKNSELYIIIMSDVAGTYDYEAKITVGISSSVKSDIQYSEQFTNGDDVKYSEIFRDVKQIDFIKDIATMFNLQFMTDQFTRTVYIEPRDNFYKTQGQDWSGKLDELSEIKIDYFKCGKYVDLKYQHGDYINELNNKTTDKYGEYTRFMRNNLFVDREEITTQLLSNVVMGSIEVGRSAFGIFSAYRMPRLWSTYSTTTIPDWNKNHAPFILYFNGAKSVSNFEIDTIPIVSNTFPEMIFYNEERNYDFNNRNGVNGLYENYWKKLLKIKDSISGEEITPNRVEAYFRLTKLDIIRILNVHKYYDLRYPVYIDYKPLRGFWYIQSIDNYNPTDDSVTRCILVKCIDKNISLIQIDADDEGDFSNTDFNGDFY